MVNFKVIVTNSLPVRQRESITREVGDVGDGSGLLCVLARPLLAWPGGEALPPPLTGGKLG